MVEQMITLTGCDSQLWLMLWRGCYVTGVCVALGWMLDESWINHKGNRTIRVRDWKSDFDGTMYQAHTMNFKNKRISRQCQTIISSINLIYRIVHSFLWNWSHDLMTIMIIVEDYCWVVNDHHWSSAVRKCIPTVELKLCSMVSKCKHMPQIALEKCDG